MKFQIPILIMVALLGAGCNRAPKNNEAIRQGVLDHLSKNTGLDVNSMTVEVTSVNYRGTEADAVVSFKPKAAPGEGMTMNYTLENQSGKWVVRKKAGSMSGAPHGGAMPGGMPGASMPGDLPGGLPPGHPPASGAAPKAGSGTGATSGSGQLPAGHPPVSSDAPKTK